MCQNTTCISSKQLNHLTNETNKSPDAASDFLLINKPFFLKALAQSKPAKWEKWGVRSRGWTLLSKPGRGSEQHYGQNEKKMLYCVGNKSQLWHDAFCSPPAVWLHLNKHTLTLSCTHKHAGVITQGMMKPCLQPAGALTQNFSRRSAMFAFTSAGTWLGSSSHQGSALEITSPLVKGKLFKSWQGCAVAEQAARRAGSVSQGFSAPGFTWMPPRCLSQPSAGKGWAELSSHTYPGKVCRVELEGSSQLRSMISHALISLQKSMQIQPGTALTPIRFNLQCFPDLIHLLWLSGYTLS